MCIRDRAEGMGKLQPLVDKVMDMPGVGSIVSPALGPIMEKMQEFGGSYATPNINTSLY